MADPIELFTLPRTDWVDADGRIYKDAIIENLNAIEAKLQEINDISLFDISLPDISEVVYPDVTLESSDDSIVNLKSFLRIMGISQYIYPIECQFNGKKLVRLSFWDNYSYKTVRNIDLDASTSKPHIIFKKNGDNDYTIEANASIPTGSMLIGLFTRGSIVGMNDGICLDFNLLQVLSKMPIASVSDNYGHNTYGGIYYAGGKIGDYHSQTGGNDLGLIRVNKKG